MLLENNTENLVYKCGLGDTLIGRKSQSFSMAILQNPEIFRFAFGASPVLVVETGARGSILGSTELATSDVDVRCSCEHAVLLAIINIGCRLTLRGGKLDDVPPYTRHKITHSWINFQSSVTSQRVRFQNRTARFRTALDEIFPMPLVSGLSIILLWST